MTFQACSISEARNLYDQLAVVTPIVVSAISYRVEITIDAFYLTKNSNLYFRSNLVVNGKSFSCVPEKGTAL